MTTLSKIVGKMFAMSMLGGYSKYDPGLRHSIKLVEKKDLKHLYYYGGGGYPLNNATIAGLAILLPAILRYFIPFWMAEFITVVGVYIAVGFFREAIHDKGNWHWKKPWIVRKFQRSLDKWGQFSTPAYITKHGKTGEPVLARGFWWSAITFYNREGYAVGYWGVDSLDGCPYEGWHEPTPDRQLPWLARKLSPKI